MPSAEISYAQIENPMCPEQVFVKSTQPLCPHPKSALGIAEFSSGHSGFCYAQSCYDMGIAVVLISRIPAMPIFVFSALGIAESSYGHSGYS